MLLTDEDYEKRYKELSTVKIELDPDPLSTGLPSINRKIAELQSQRERVNAMLIEAIKNKSEANILFDAKKGDHGRQLENLLATDQDVKVQKSSELRKATANVKLKDLVIDMAYSELEAQKADAYYKCVQQMYGHLESANMNLSRQISVIQMGVQIREIDVKTTEGSQGRSVSVK